jgi:hypothetical protein
LFYPLLFLFLFLFFGVSCVAFGGIEWMIGWRWGGSRHRSCCLSVCVYPRVWNVVCIAFRLRQIGGSGIGKVSRGHRLLGSLFSTGCTVSHQMFSPRQVREKPNRTPVVETILEVPGSDSGLNLVGHRTRASSATAGNDGDVRGSPSRRVDTQPGLSESDGVFATRGQLVVGD